MPMPDVLFRGGPFEKLSEYLWKLMQTQPNKGRWGSFLKPDNMPVLAEMVANAGREWYSLPLNLSPESLTSLEILIDLENDRTVNRVDRGRVNAGLRATGAAAYLGEVICKHLNGQWAAPESHEEGLSDDVLVQVGPHNINVLSYVRQVIDTPKGKITAFYQTIADELQEG